MPLAETELIQRIRRMAGSRTPPPRRRGLAGSRRRLVVAIGDDCAVLEPRRGEELLVTTDLSLEGVHFRREWHGPEAVGHRALARGLSDIAAMGGEPIAVFLSLALPRRLPQSWVDRFFDGFLKLAREFRVPLAGGDTSESPTGVMVDVIVVGSTQKGTAILRSGARPGDRIYVSGELGASAAALELLASRQRRLNRSSLSSHFFPTPRIELGRMLRRKRIPSAMIDTSDGLSTDLFHLCEESHSGAEITADAVPRARMGRHGPKVKIALALHGGEDYELLFTAPSDCRVPRMLAGVPITEIGFMCAKPRKIQLRSQDSLTELRVRGWQHFHN